MTLALLIFVLGTLTIAGLIAGGWGFETGRRTAEAACAFCRYPIHGLRSAVCPECGKELSGAGTLRTGSRRRIRPPILVAAFCRTVLVAVAAVVIAIPLNDQYPCAVSTARADATSPTGLSRSLHISGRGSTDATELTSYNIGVPRSATRATLSGPNRTVSLRVRDAAMRVTYDGPGGKRVRTLDAMTEDDALQWMQAAGVATNGPNARGEANAIMNLIRAVVIGGTGPPSGLSRASMTCDRYDMPQTWVLVMLCAVSAGVWAVLLWNLRSWRAGRRPLASPTAPLASPSPPSSAPASAPPTPSPSSPAASLP